MASQRTVTLNNGLKMPILGLGTAGPSDQVYQAVRDAIQAGYRHFDTADLYNTEDAVGRAINDAIKAGEVTREEVFVVTKLRMDKMRREKILPALKESLEKLNLPYVDLYLVHAPTATVSMGAGDGKYEFDNDLDIYNETWKAMEELIELGLTKSIGISNFNSKQVDEVIKVAKVKPVTNQVECHPFLSQRKLIDHCSKYGIVLTAYSPMGGTPPADEEARKKRATHMNYDIKQQLFDIDLIKQLATKYGKSAGQILLKFQIDRDVIVIPKSVTKSRIIENAQIFDFELTKEELDQLEGLNQNLRYIHGEGSLKESKYYPFDIEY